ncbi:MAG: DUF2812 domain-containing protein [Dysosmobacter sp.]
MKNTKRELVFYSFYDFTGLASHLEAMAAKGWLAEKIGTLSIRYRRIQPQTLRFAVTYFPDASEFDAAPTSGQEVFRDYCAQAGWEFAFQWAQMQVFYTSRPDAVPIETDPSIQVETIHRSMRRNFLPGTILMLILSLFQLGMLFWRINTDPVDLLSNASYLLSFFLLAAGAAGQHLVAGTLCALAPPRRTGSSDGPHVRHPYQSGRKSFTALRRSAVHCGRISLLLFPARDRISGRRRRHRCADLLFDPGREGLLPPPWCLPESHPDRHHGHRLPLQLRTADGRRRSLYHKPLGVDDTTAVETYSWHNITWEVYADPIPLRMEDLTGAAIYGSDTYSTGSWEQSSLLVSWRRYSQDLRHDCPEELPELNYSIVDVKIPLFYSTCKTYLLEQYVRRDANLPPEYQERYKALDTLPQGTTAAYQCYMGEEPLNQYLLCWDSRLIELWFDEPLTAAQLDTAAAILADA